MSQTEADTIYGKVIHRDDNFVIRVKITNKGLRVIVHHIVNEKEMTPQGYILGKNALIMMKGK